MTSYTFVVSFAGSTTTIFANQVRHTRSIQRDPPYFPGHGYGDADDWHGDGDDGDDDDGHDDHEVDNE
eukprot:390424-Rhodomonas_salina.1